MKKELRKELLAKTPLGEYDEDFIQETTKRSIKAGNEIIPGGKINLYIAVEECSELLQEITKCLRKKLKRTDMVEEMADALLGCIYIENVIGIQRKKGEESKPTVTYEDSYESLMQSIIGFQYVVMDIILDKKEKSVIQGQKDWLEQHGIPNIEKITEVLSCRLDISHEEIQQMMMVKIKRLADALDKARTAFGEDRHYEKFM